MVSLAHSTANPGYQQCSRCLMDTSAAGITFDTNGHCNFCSDYKSNMSAVVFESVESKTARLNEFVARVKQMAKANLTIVLSVFPVV